MLESTTSYDTAIRTVEHLTGDAHASLASS